MDTLATFTVMILVFGVLSFVLGRLYRNRPIEVIGVWLAILGVASGLWYLILTGLLSL